MIPIPAYQKKLNDFLVAVNPLGGISVMERYAADRFLRRQRQRGSFSKFRALYLVIGGDAARHKLNFVSPLDSDGAYRLSFSGTVTHDANGFQGDGSTGYADTHFNPPDTQPDRIFGVSFYSRTNSQETAKDYGARTPATLNYMEARNDAGNCRVANYADNALTVTNTDGRGYFAHQRINPSQITRMIRTSTVTTLSHGDDAEIGFSIYLMCINNEGTAESFCARQYCFWSLTIPQTYLTDTEQQGLRDDVIDFQTFLGRNV